MKTLEINPSLFIGIDAEKDYPIQIESEGDLVNLTFEELKTAYEFAKKELAV